MQLGALHVTSKDIGRNDQAATHNLALRQAIILGTRRLHDPTRQQHHHVARTVLTLTMTSRTVVIIRPALVMSRMRIRRAMLYLVCPLVLLGLLFAHFTRSAKILDRQPWPVSFGITTPSSTRPPSDALTDATSVLDAYEYRGCHPHDMIAPHANMTELELFRNFERAYRCLLRKYHIPQDGAADVYDVHGPIGEDIDSLPLRELKKLSRTHLELLKANILAKALESKEGIHRGLYVNSSRTLRQRLKGGVRKCPGGLVVCGVLRNEAAYVQEWLAFHIHSGVEHFYVYLNNDEEDTMAALQPFVEAGLVTAHVLNGHGPQMKAYSRCLTRARTSQKLWQANIDADEYLFLTDGGCLMDYFGKIHDRAAHTINWRTFTHSNHIFRLPKNVLLSEANIHSRGNDENLHVDVQTKSVVRVDRTRKCYNPHYCHYIDGYKAMDEIGREVPTQIISPPSNEKINLYHYHFRSYEDFFLKRARGRASVNKEWVFPSEKYEADLLHGGMWGTQHRVPTEAVKAVKYVLGMDHDRP